MPPSCSTKNLRGICRTNAKEKLNDTIEFGPTPATYFADITSPDSHSGPSYSFSRTERKLHNHLGAHRKERVFEDEEVRAKRVGGYLIPKESRFDHDFEAKSRAQLPGPGHYEFLRGSCERLCTATGENPPHYSIPKQGAAKSDADNILIEGFNKFLPEAGSLSPRRSNNNRQRFLNGERFSEQRDGVKIKMCNAIAARRRDRKSTRLNSSHR